MIIKRWVGCLACLFCIASSLPAATQKTSPPFIYVIDYGDKWIKDPDAAKVFGDMPPDVLHIGKAVPVTHNWGPIPLMAGENQYTGGPTLNREMTRLLTPSELEQKMKLITAAVERLHAAGIKIVMPYICFFTIAGDHESHEGLWKFYDHWEEYARWMGPKPPESPTEWVTKNANGKRIESGYGYTPPYYAPLHRYAVCPNNPSWNQFSAAIVRLIAQCGYDGVFVDNSTIGGDGCKYCQAAFPKWVNENFDPATLKRICGGQEVGQITLDNPKLNKILVRRWHLAVIRDRLAMLRRAGAEIKSGFQTFPNVGNIQCVLPFGDGCDLFMFEGTLPPGCLTEGEPPENPDAIITVAEGADTDFETMRYEAIHAEACSEVTGEVRFPRICPPNKPVEITVKLLRVGQSTRDDDALEELTVQLTHIQSGQRDEVQLGSEKAVGAPGAVPGAKRPPIELKGTWSPRECGSYALDITYKYTDTAHPEVPPRTPIADRPSLRNVYRVNLPGLSCTFNSRCKTIGLMTGTKGLNTAHELALAEGAASGGRHAVQSSGELMKKYWTFFHKHGHVGAGLVPYGSVTLLYSYWGGNPGTVGGAPTQTVAEHLSAQHILYRGLVDRDLEASDLTPAQGHTLVLVCRNYTLSDAQINALRDFIHTGGKVVIEHADAQINFMPIAEALGIPLEKFIFWDWRKPIELDTPLCPSTGRLRGVRFTAFVDPAQNPKKLVLHALNYNVALVGTKAGTVTPISNLQLCIPTPALWRKVNAKVYDPDNLTPAPLDCAVVDGSVRLILPTLNIYQMVELVGE